MDRSEHLRDRTISANLAVDRLRAAAKCFGCRCIGSGNYIGIFTGKKAWCHHVVQWSFTLAVFAFSTKLPLSMAMMVFIGVGKLEHMTAGTVLIQAYTALSLLRRTLSILQLSMGLGGLSSFIISVLAETVGVQWAVGGFALLLIPDSILALIYLPNVRNWTNK